MFFRGRRRQQQHSPLRDQAVKPPLMDAILHAVLDRMETSITRLVESIQNHSPSETAFQDIVAADDDLRRCLDQLWQHASNVRILHALRQENEALSTDLLAMMEDLARMRASILSTSIPARSGTARPVPYDTLLSAARAVSRFGAPASFRPTAQGLALTDAARPGTADADAYADANPGLALLSDAERGWLDPLTRVPFTPWPNEEMIGRSALARTQGIQPAAEHEAAGAAAAGRTEAASGGAVATEDAKGEDTGAANHREGDKSVAAPRKAQEAKPAVFGGMDLYDPDEDEQ